MDRQIGIGNNLVGRFIVNKFQRFTVNIFDLKEFDKDLFYFEEKIDNKEVQPNVKMIHVDVGPESFNICYESTTQTVSLSNNRGSVCVQSRVTETESIVIYPFQIKKWSSTRAILSLYTPVWVQLMAPYKKGRIGLFDREIFPFLEQRLITEPSFQIYGAGSFEVHSTVPLGVLPRQHETSPDPDMTLPKKALASSPPPNVTHDRMEHQCSQC
jgi:hypothetical protein